MDDRFNDPDNPNNAHSHHQPWNQSAQFQQHQQSQQQQQQPYGQTAVAPPSAPPIPSRSGSSVPMPTSQPSFGGAGMGASGGGPSSTNPAVAAAMAAVRAAQAPLVLYTHVLSNY